MCFGIPDNFVPPPVEIIASENKYSALFVFFFTPLSILFIEITFSFMKYAFFILARIFSLTSEAEFETGKILPSSCAYVSIHN